jgi:hypothetical protein
LHKNVDHHSEINKGSKEAENKGTEETFGGRETKEPIGETFKIQETTDLPPTHEL